MTTMLEKMARAVWTQLPQDDANMATSKRIARAALQAIREPDETVLAAALSCDDRANFADKAFTDIIDAILEEKPG